MMLTFLSKFLAETRSLAAKVLLITLIGFLPSQSFASSVTIQFDTVKVTGKAGAGADTGFVIYSVEPIGNGPYKDKNGAAAIDFFKQKPDGSSPSFLNGFTGAGIFDNQFEFRYFGSIAAAKGSVLRNLTNIRIKPDGSSEAAAGNAIDGFEIKLAQPTQDNIDAASGGNAFPNTVIAADKKSVKFSGGRFPVGGFPAAGASGNFLWSFITPAGDQPKFPQVFSTVPVIPPDPTGDFKKIKYVGKAIPAVPLPAAWLLMMSGLGVFAGLKGLNQRRLA
jgi:hypothetical protein